jgi:hypothetical protein
MKMHELKKEFIHIMSENLCIRIFTSEKIIKRNDMVLEILSGPLKFMYANQLLGMILWMDIM